jgi:hypothetical protein
LHEIDFDRSVRTAAEEAGAMSRSVLVLCGGWAAVLFLLASPIARADRLEPALFNGGGFENDDAFNLFHHTDRNYTAGLSLSFSGGWVDRAHLTAPIEAFDWLFQTGRAYDWMDRASARISRGYDFTLAIALYTPADLRVAAPIRDDHPYASLETFFVSHTSFSESLRLFPGLPGGLALSSDFTLGLLGLDWAQQAQSWVHLLARNGVKESCTPNSSGISPPEPCGWHNQISNGGEPTLLYACTSSSS